jgi:hypothetical protein
MWNTARALGFLGLVLGDDNYLAAQASLQESMALFRGVHDDWGYTVDVMWLGWAAYKNDDETTALALHEQALAEFRKLGDRYFQCVCLRPIGILHIRQGDLPRGLAALRESLTLAQQLGSKYESAGALYRIADAAQQTGNSARAVSLYWAAKIVFESIGAWQPEDDLDFETKLALCRNALGESVFATAVQQGHALTMEQAIELAILGDQEFEADRAGIAPKSGKPNSRKRHSKSRKA